MRVLCLDTATPDIAAAVVDTTSGASWSRVVRDARGAGEHLMPLAESACAAGGVALTDLDAIAVGLGPGPYTGLRVGVVTAAALGAALGIPAHGCCSLDAWALPDSIVATDARRREVFWARYDAAGSRIDGPHVDRPADVTPELGPDVAVVGPGAVLLGAEADDREIPIARLASLVDLSADPVPLTPTYLRRPDATEPVR